jgi:antitoxin VapB
MVPVKQLNVKSPDAHRLAFELAQLTGKSVTHAVVDALELSLKHARQAKSKKRRGIARELMKLSAEARKLPVLDTRHPDVILYDKHGLPRA